MSRARGSYFRQACPGRGDKSGAEASGIGPDGQAQTDELHTKVMERRLWDYLCALEYAYETIGIQGPPPPRYRLCVYLPPLKSPPNVVPVRPPTRGGGGK